MKGLIRQRDEIDEMQCDFTSSHGTKYAFLLYEGRSRSNRTFAISSVHV